MSSFSFLPREDAKSPEVGNPAETRLRTSQVVDIQGISSLCKCVGQKPWHQCFHHRQLCKQAQLCCLQHSTILSCTVSTWVYLLNWGSSKISNMIYSILWHSHVCIKMKGWLLFTNMYGKKLELIYILDRKTNLWCSKTKHQSFIQEHQKAFIIDFHKMFSANRTFGGGKIESFCIKAICSNCYSDLWVQSVKWNA